MCSDRCLKEGWIRQLKTQFLTMHSNSKLCKTYTMIKLPICATMILLVSHPKISILGCEEKTLNKIKYLIFFLKLSKIYLFVGNTKWGKYGFIKLLQVNVFCLLFLCFALAWLSEKWIYKSRSNHDRLSPILENKTSKVLLENKFKVWVWKAF